MRQMFTFAAAASLCLGAFGCADRSVSGGGTAAGSMDSPSASVHGGTSGDAARSGETAANASKVGGGTGAGSGTGTNGTDTGTSSSKGTGAGGAGNGAGAGH